MFLPTNLLDRVELDNVTFTQNITNRIQLLPSATFPISNTTILSAQPGLDGYEFEGGLVVVDAGNLTLEPGVTLFCAPDAGVVVQNGGHLTAGGTSENPVTFTTITDTAVGRWWGNQIGPAGNGSGSGNAVWGKVLFAPWLAQWVGDAPFALYLPTVIPQ